MFTSTVNFEAVAGAIFMFAVVAVGIAVAYVIDRDWPAGGPGF